MPEIAYQLAPAPPASPAKAPGDVLDYLLSFAQEFSASGGSPGDTLASITALSVSPTGSLQVASGSIASGGLAVLFWAASGVSGQTYTISVTAQTTGGRTYVREALLPVASI